MERANQLLLYLEERRTPVAKSSLVLLSESFPSERMTSHRLWILSLDSSGPHWSSPTISQKSRPGSEGHWPTNPEVCTIRMPLAGKWKHQSHVFTLSLQQHFIYKVMSHLVVFKLIPGQQNEKWNENEINRSVISNLNIASYLALYLPIMRNSLIKQGFVHLLQLLWHHNLSLDCKMKRGQGTVDDNQEMVESADLLP